MPAIVHGLRDRGLITVTDPDLGTTHTPTFRCAHCGNIRPIDPRKSASDMGGWCFNCQDAICAECADNPHCLPFLKRLDQMEARDRLRRQALGEYR